MLRKNVVYGNKKVSGADFFYFKVYVVNLMCKFLNYLCLWGVKNVYNYIRIK